MKTSAIVFVALFGITFAGTLKTLNKRNDGHFESQAFGAGSHAFGAGSHAFGAGSHAFDLGTVAPTTIVTHQFDENKGFSAGSGLRSIAQGSAHQANTAVLNQHAAAKQAAYVAQTTLAQSAIQAASTALAALAGKEVLVENLEHQLGDADRSLDSEVAQLESAKRAASAAKEAADLAARHVTVLTAALNSAQATAEHAERASEQIEAELASQTAMVGKAKGRLDSVAQKLHAAQIDFVATKESASEATAAAEQAQNNAAHAGYIATEKLHESASYSVLGSSPATYATHQIADDGHGHFKH